MTDALRHLESLTGRPPRRLSDLAAGEGRLDGDAEIAGIRDDSRALAPGEAFLCLPRAAEKAGDYARQAAERGAAALISVAAAEGPGAAVAAVASERGLPHLALPDMPAVGRLLRRWFDTEHVKTRLVGVTGTDGKTSVAWMLREAAQRRLGRAWAVGTLGWVRGPDDWADIGNTTPSLLTLHRLLAAAADAGVPLIACEVSSHGIEQQRIAGLPFAAAVWTNLGHDHLQDHGGFEAYAAIKQRFVDAVAAAGRPVIANLDDAEVRRRLPAGASGFGRGLYRDDVALGWEQELPGMVRLRCAGSPAQGGDAAEVRIEDVPVGEFHAANLAAVALTLLELGLARMDELPALLAGVTAPPGRMQALNIGRWQVFVDYAHTPEALESCLAAARRLARGRLFVVFGCGGERDREKRPRMGEIAARMADVVWITSDNPRGEPPAVIASEIEQGIPRPYPAEVHLQLDRGLAIAEAIEAMQAGDALVIAGKGHEAYMDVAGERRPWSDEQAAARALRAKMRRLEAGPERRACA